MTGQVTLYFNTGFNGTDLPENPGVLSLARSKTYDSVVWIREDVDKPAIRIPDTYENVRDVDYVAITTSSGTSYFVAGAPQMAAPAVAVIPLDLDGMLTMGGAGEVDYISGWQERGHIAKEDDALFSNVAAEEWVPTQPLQNRNMRILSMTSQTPADLDVTVSNIDLGEVGTWDVDEQKVLQGTSEGEAVMYLPKVPSAKALSECRMWDFVENRSHKFVIPGTTLYNLGNTTVKAALEKLFSCGQLQLQASYKIPKEWVRETKLRSDGSYEYIEGSYAQDTLNEQPFEYVEGGYTPKNKKVFSTYRTYTLASVGSGDMCVKSAEDIYDGLSVAPKVNLWADPCSTGKPYARFDYIRGSGIQYIDCVKGLQWSNSQLVMEGASGSMWNSINTAFSNQQIQRSIQQNTFNMSQALRQGDLTRQGIELSQTQSDLNTIGDLVGLIAGAASNLTYSSTPYGGSSGIQYKRSIGAKSTEGVGGQVGSLINSQINYKMSHEMTDLSLNKLNTNMASVKANAGMNEQAMLQQINENNIGLLKNNNVVAPTVNFTPEQNLGLYGYDYFVCYETRKSLDDLKSEDMYYQRFGYNGLHRPLTKQCFKERQYYCYVQAFDVNLKGKKEFGLRVRAKAISQLNKGCRFWKVLPDASYYELN